MAITRADILSGSESNSNNRVEFGERKITVIAPRDGSSMAPNLFSPITCSNDEVHCYFPYSDDFLSSMAEMIKKVKEERPNKKIHHIELTLSLYNTGVVQTANQTNGDAYSLCSSISENSHCSNSSKSEAVADDMDDDDQWTDISSDETVTEPEEGEQASAYSAPPDQLNAVDVPQKSVSQIKKRNRRPNAAQPSAANKICIECGQQFKNSYRLREHMTKHSTQRPFKCATCGKTFKQRCTLNQHQFLVHSKDSFAHSCEKCGRKFAFRSHLIRHMKKAHSRE